MDLLSLTSKSNCTGCALCIDDDPTNTVCKDSRECDPFFGTKLVLPFIMFIAFIYLCIACCIRRNPSFADNEDINIREHIPSSLSQQSNKNSSQYSRYSYRKK